MSLAQMCFKTRSSTCSTVAMCSKGGIGLIQDAAPFNKCRTMTLPFQNYSFFLVFCFVLGHPKSDHCTCQSNPRHRYAREGIHKAGSAAINRPCFAVTPIPASRQRATKFRSVTLSCGADFPPRTFHPNGDQRAPQDAFGQRIRFATLVLAE
jgi:hypothetical protein